MTKLQFYKYGMWLLLLVNIGIMTFLIMGRKPPRGPGAQVFQERAYEILQLDEAQKSKFADFAAEHNKNISTIINQNESVIEPFFTTINSSDITAKDSLQKMILQLELEKINETYRHFEEIKEMLSTHQKDNFDQFMHEAINIIMLKNGPPPQR